MFMKSITLIVSAATYAHAWQMSNWGCWDKFSKNSVVNDNCPEVIPWRMRCDTTTHIVLRSGDTISKVALTTFSEDGKQVLTDLLEEKRCSDVTDSHNDIRHRITTFHNYAFNIASAPDTFWMKYVVNRDVDDTGESYHEAQCIRYRRANGGKDDEYFQDDGRYNCCTDTGQLCVED